MAKDIFRGGFGRLCWRMTANLNTELQHGKRFYAASGLQEFGKCEETRSADIPYDPGQLFLHKSFLYRGIVLFSWNSSVITHTSDKQKDKTSKNANVKSHIPDSKRMKRNFQQYYMALTDPRDSPYKRNQMEAMHYLKERDDISTAVCTASNTDIVNHHDIIPYSSTEEIPIANELFKAYFDYDKNKVPACRVKPELNNAIQMHFPWADMDNVVYKETTKNIQVTCIPFFLGASKSEKTSKKYTWMYCIRIENLGLDTLQIRQREWLLFCNSTAKINTERGPTVEGQEPVLSPERKCYQYVSIVHLNSPRGSLWGSYTMVRPDGTEVIIRIPRMELRCDDDNNL
ncbi:polymerase delta-interacting protein 2-like isoform X2 [Mizuhopecten yessoensis]|uniref:Polymerase delta-interacting protein 2 n=1 Tax=Mizuhopecten yessoensis TaxID=6573 RepID=A0A210Q1R7_MIZYE|nr:polymerase delta-interacting protein 2-like isoform X2 [Mizuhopecten yessoensis]OWF42688.1 polymerase delta-interacting protein 2 [Mizuhopecten yessoensis]